MTELTTHTLMPWFGTDRSVAAANAAQVGQADWIGIPFCGGCGIVEHLRARTILVNDLHRAMVNLARVTADRKLRRRLMSELMRLPFHPDVLATAQQYCRDREAQGEDSLFHVAKPFSEEPDYEWAKQYFISGWMARSCDAGTKGEFNGGLALRWNAGGGDSVVRFRSAATSLKAWNRLLECAQFSVMDVFDILEQAWRVEQTQKLLHIPERRSLYIDAPWPEDGDSYRHTFPTPKQRRLAEFLSQFKTTRVVVRFNDHPLIRELYPKSHWTIIERMSKDQHNEDTNELCIVNGRSNEPDRS